MILHFVGGQTSSNLSIIKETKKYIIFRCQDNEELEAIEELNEIFNL